MGPMKITGPNVVVNNNATHSSSSVRSDIRSWNEMWEIQNPSWATRPPA